MKQVIEEMRSGVVRVVESPVPSCGADQLLIQNAVSLISPGTEKMLIEMGRKSLVGKARARPDLVRLAYHKARKEGFLRVVKEALARLDVPITLGYSSAGEVLEVGHSVRGFAVGHRVACAGYGYADHAETIAVPANLCVRLDDGVTQEEGSFVMLGGIAMHGFRSADLSFGESVAVVGLGLIGLLTIQIAKAYGCLVIGVDVDPKKVKLAKALGCAHAITIGGGDAEARIQNLTGGQGVDAVLLTAATRDNSPILLAEKIARKRGRIVLVGVSDLHLTRKAFWDKELVFTVSRASGPSSETHGTPFLPPDLVRWSEQRNLEEFIRLTEAKSINVKELITHRFDVTEAVDAYQMILNGRESYIGVLLQYPQREGPGHRPHRKKVLAPLSPLGPDVRANVGFIGAGLFTRNFLAPTVRSLKSIRMIGVAAKTSLSAHHLASKFGFAYASTDYKQLLEDPRIGSVIIATRHDLHGGLVVEALRNRKHVFVEKPLCTNASELASIVSAKAAAPESHLMVGFNRRHSSLARRCRELVRERAVAMQIVCRVNAGYIPPESWIQDPALGAGRIIGEVCHFVDLIQFLTGAEPVEVSSEAISGFTGKYQTNDNVCLNLRMSDGSLGTIVYTSLGSKLFSRERIELFWEESAAVIDDFRSLEVVTSDGRTAKKLRNQDMGYRDELESFFGLDTKTAALLFRGSVLTTAATFAAIESLQSHHPVFVKA